MKNKNTDVVVKSWWAINPPASDFFYYDEFTKYWYAISRKKNLGRVIEIQGVGKTKARAYSNLVANSDRWIDNAEAFVTYTDLHKVMYTKYKD